MGLGLRNGVASPNLLLHNGPIPVISNWWQEDTKLPDNPVVDFTRPVAPTSSQVTPVSQLTNPDYKPAFNIKTIHEAAGQTDYGWTSGIEEHTRRRDPWSNFVNKVLRPAFGISSEQVSGSDIDYSNNLSSWLSNLLKHFV